MDDEPAEGPSRSEVIELDNSQDEDLVNRQQRTPSPQSRVQPVARSIVSSNKRKKPESDDLEDEKDEKEDLTRTTIQNDAEVCPICLEEWTNSGQHRLVATECGHLFGKMFVHYRNIFT